MTDNETGAPAEDRTPHFDSRLIDALQECGAVVRPMIGGGFAFEDEEGEWDGKRYGTWRIAALEALRYIGGEHSRIADEITLAGVDRAPNDERRDRLWEDIERTVEMQEIEAWGADGEPLDLAQQVDRLADLRTRAEAEVSRLTAELAAARKELADAAREINCAGPVAHRIRMLRQELSDENARLTAALDRVRDDAAQTAIAADWQNACPTCCGSGEVGVGQTHSAKCVRCNGTGLTAARTQPEGSNE